MEKEEKLPEEIQEITGEVAPIETTDVQETVEPPIETPVAFGKLKKRMSSLYPDRQFESDDDYDNLTDEYLGAREEADNMLISIFDQHPVIREVLSDLKDGAEVPEALAIHYSPEELTRKEGDKNYDKWSANNAEREKKKSDQLAQETEIESNLETSSQALKEFADENGLDETGLGDFVNGIQGIFDAYNMGVISKETLSLLQKGQKYDADMAAKEEEKAASFEEGVIQGRNEQIAAKKIPKDDGIPTLAGGGEVLVQKTKTPQELGAAYIDKLK
jgi:hypothetical protein